MHDADVVQRDAESRLRTTDGRRSQNHAVDDNHQCRNARLREELCSADGCPKHHPRIQQSIHPGAEQNSEWHHFSRGDTLNFKVYKTNEINAFAYADSSIRVYSGLMDVMDDDEVLGVIGHEIGHVAHEDTKNAFKKALQTSALMDVMASTGSTAAAHTDSQVGAIAQNLAQAKYSKSQESNADDYGYDFLKEHGKNPRAMVKAYEKLKEMEQPSGSSANSRLSQLSIPT